MSTGKHDKMAGHAKQELMHIKKEQNYSHVMKNASVVAGDYVEKYWGSTMIKCYKIEES